MTLLLGGRELLAAEFFRIGFRFSPADASLCVPVVKDEVRTSKREGNDIRVSLWHMGRRLPDCPARSAHHSVWQEESFEPSERGMVWTAPHGHRVVQKSENVRSGKTCETLRTYMSTIWLAVKKSSGYLIDLEWLDRTSCSTSL